MDPRFPPPAPCSAGGGGGAPRGHRRAHSETFIRFPDADLLLDPDSDFSFSDLDFPSLSDDSPAVSSDPAPPPPPLPPQGAAASSPAAPRPPGGGGGAHMRSLSLDAAFFDGLALQGGGGGGGGGAAGHKRSGSMDGASSPSEGESALSGGTLPDYAKKASGCGGAWAGEQHREEVAERDEEEARVAHEPAPLDDEVEACLGRWGENEKDRVVHVHHVTVIDRVS